MAERPVPLPPESGGARRADNPFFLDGIAVDPEAKRVIGVAFEMARVALSLAGGRGPPDEIIAKRIIELAKTGERNPDLLCEGVLKEFRDQHV